MTGARSYKINSGSSDNPMKENHAAYLLRSPANARRLLSAADQLSAGKGTERKLTQ